MKCPQCRIVEMLLNMATKTETKYKCPKCKEEVAVKIEKEMEI